MAGEIYVDQQREKRGGAQCGVRVASTNVLEQVGDLEVRD